MELQIGDRNKLIADKMLRAVAATFEGNRRSAWRRSAS